MLGMWVTTGLPEHAPVRALNAALGRGARLWGPLFHILPGWFSRFKLLFFPSVVKDKIDDGMV